MPPTDRALKPVSSARTNATKDLGRGDPVANGPPSKESDHNHSGRIADAVTETVRDHPDSKVERTDRCAVDGETVETVTTAVAGALAAAAKQVREQLPVSDFCQDAEPARKPVVERTETRKERVKRLVASLMHATRAELADLIPALVKTSSDLNLLRVYLHRICESKQKDHVSTKKDIQERFKTIVILLETSSSIGSELTELIKEYLNANENESNIRFEYNKAAHISALFVVYADIAELKADSAAERKVLEDKIALLNDTYDEQAKCSEAKIAQLRSDLA